MFNSKKIRSSDGSKTLPYVNIQNCPILGKPADLYAMLLKMLSIEDAYDTKLRTHFHHFLSLGQKRSITYVISPKRGRGDFHMKGAGMLVVSLRVFWVNAIILSRESLV